MFLALFQQEWFQYQGCRRFRGGTTHVAPPTPRQPQLGIRRVFSYWDALNEILCGVTGAFIDRMYIVLPLYSGTTTEFWIPDHWVQAAVMVKIRTFKLNPDLFRTFSRFTCLYC